VQLSTIHPWNKALWQQLMNNQQLPQAIMLVGREGLGKRHFATQFAAHILDGDNVFYNGNHPDFHVIAAEDDWNETDLLSKYSLRYLPGADKRSSGKPKAIIAVQQIRDLIKQATQHPQISDYKVIMIDSADKMNVNAANALLKTLEEPTSNTIFILVSDRLDRIPVTIRSRCVIHKVRAPHQSFGLEWLQKQSNDAHLESYLSMAAGAPLMALSMAENDYISQVREIFTQLNKLWSRKQNVVQTAKAWSSLPMGQVVDCLQKLLLDVSRLSSVNDANGDDSTELLSEWIRRSCLS